MIAGVLGGVINLAGNAISGNVHSWGEGFSYFGIGFGAGVATLYSGPVAGGMIIAGGNSIVNQGFTDGFNNISWGQVGNNTLMGGITGAGSLVQKPLNSAFSSVASPVLRQSLVQGTTGTISGFVTNTTMSRVNGSSWEDALYAGREGAIWSLTLGTVGGAYQGLKYARSNNLDPWTGEKRFQLQESLPNNIFSSKAPMQVTPGTKTLEGLYINDRGRIEPWRAAYDEFGRFVERTDWNAGNKTHNISNTHYHERIYLPKFQILKIDHIPGVGSRTGPKSPIK